MFVNVAKARAIISNIIAAVISRCATEWTEASFTWKCHSEGII